MKKNIAVILAFTLPILLVIGIALSVYLPSLSLTTDYNFIYATCDQGTDNYYPESYSPYTCVSYLNARYQVENGKLTTAEVPPPLAPPPRELTNNQPYIIPVTRLFLHDSQNNEGREIALAEAQTLKLNGLITSPDGVSMESAHNRGAEFFPFFNGSSSFGYYLTKGNKKRKLNLVGEDARYYYGRDNFKFIGWVIAREGKI